MARVQIAPSILAADFARLGEQIAAAEEAGADWIHVDVMDGHFVPNLTMGPAIAAAARRSTRLPLDVHLMIERPERFVGPFADAGVDSITVHSEVSPHLHRTVQAIQELGLRAGVALNPGTPASVLEEIIPFADLILVMTVNPGFGGQSYIPSMTRKIEIVRGMMDATGREAALLEVDGGIDATTAPEVARAGATLLVAGSAVFGGGGTVAENLARLRESVTSV
jgi:ribulose-phosphate 3-epimerase